MKQRENPDKYIHRVHTDDSIPTVVFNFKNIKDKISVREQDGRIIVTRTDMYDSSTSFQKELFEKLTDSTEFTKETVVEFLYITLTHTCNYMVWEQEGDMLLSRLTIDEVDTTHKDKLFSLKMGRKCYKKYTKILEEEQIFDIAQQSIKIKIEN